MDTPESNASEIKRWTAKRKMAVVLELIQGKTTAAQVARQHDLTVAEVEGWREAFLAAGEERMRSNPRDAEAQWEAQKKDLHAKIGEQALHIDVLKKRTVSAARSYRTGSPEPRTQRTAAAGHGSPGGEALPMATGPA